MNDTGYCDICAPYICECCDHCGVIDDCDCCVNCYLPVHECDCDGCVADCPCNGPACECPGAPIPN